MYCPDLLCSWDESGVYDRTSPKNGISAKKNIGKKRRNSSSKPIVRGQVNYNKFDW